MIAFILLTPQFSELQLLSTTAECKVSGTLYVIIKRNSIEKVPFCVHCLNSNYFINFFINFQFLTGRTLKTFQSNWNYRSYLINKPAMHYLLCCCVLRPSAVVSALYVTIKAINTKENEWTSLRSIFNWNLLYRNHPVKMFFTWTTKTQATTKAINCINNLTQSNQSDCHQ